MLDYLSKDSKFLEEQKVMDYSLLLGIQKGLRKTEDSSGSSGTGGGSAGSAAGNDFEQFAQAAALDGAETFYFGIIDFLQVTNQPNLNHPSCVHALCYPPAMLPHASSFSCGCLRRSLEQEWDKGKRAERWAKVLFKGWDDISAVQPDLYQKRFVYRLRQRFPETELELEPPESPSPSRRSARLGVSRCALQPTETHTHTHTRARARIMLSRHHAK